MVRDGVGEAPGHEDEVEQGQQAPHGAEEEEVDFGGGGGMPEARPPVGNCVLVSGGRWRYLGRGAVFGGVGGTNRSRTIRG